MKRSTARLLGATVLAPVLALSACAGGDEPEESGGETPADDGDAAASETYEVGITQIVSHPALDAARDGFKAALDEAGLDVTYDEQNAQNDQATATSIANTFASDGKDLVLAIATPTAQASAQAITDIPVLFTAVTDPVEAGLVDSWESPGGNITGTSDMNPVEDQLGLLQDIDPQAETVGIVYSSGEVNSEIQVEMAQEAADGLGLEIETATVTNSGEVQQAAESLEVDAFYVPTDNTVVSALESLIQVAESASIPVITAEGESVERGGVATYGIDYEQLGRQTGEMAVQILQEGTDPADIPVETQTALALIVNPGAATRMGVEIPAELLAQAETVIE